MQQLVRVASRRQFLLVAGVRIWVIHVKRVCILSNQGVRDWGKWLVCGDCVGRRDPPRAVCDSYADNGFASSLGTWAPNASAPFRCNICRALDAAKYRESVVGVYQNRCDPSSICRDIFAVRPWMLDLRRASPTELRSALLRAKKRLPPSNTSGLEDALGQGGEAPSDGTLLL